MTNRNVSHMLMVASGGARIVKGGVSNNYIHKPMTASEYSRSQTLFIEKQGKQGLVQCDQI